MASHSHLALPRARRRLTGFDVWVTVVTIAGLMLFARVLPAAIADARDADLSFWILAACVLPAELIRIPVWRGHAVAQIAMSRPFALALLIGWGLPLAVVVFTAASIVSDLLHRKPLQRVCFNAGQYALSLGAAGAVYQALGGQTPLGLAQIPAFFVATIVLVLVNRLLVLIAVILLEHWRLTLATLVAGAHVEFLEGAIQFSMALVALLVADHRVVLPIVLAVPALPMYVAGRAAEQAEEASQKYAKELLHYRHLFVVADRFRRQAEAGSGVNSLQLAAMALDLRTSTAMIKGLLGTISREAERRDLGLLRDLAANGVEHAEQLAEKLDQLQSSASAAQRAEPVRQPVDATELVSVAEQLAKTICKRRPVVVEAPSEEDSLPLCVNQDEILDVLGNLVLNADRYAPPETAIQLSAFRQDDRVVLSVEDEGIDVAPEQRERIFDQPMSDEGDRRLGHGLAMARQLAHANGGELRAVDPGDAGGRARFELRLPLADQPAPLPDPTVTV
jgi:signal transduction histidine kinase